MPRRPSVRAPEEYPLKVGEVRNAAADFTGLLDDGESLTGTPTIAVTVDGEANTDLQFSSIAVNTSTITINGQTVTAGKAIQFAVNTANGTAGKRYILTLSAVSNSEPAQTILREVTIDLVV